jgi:DMSO/TMAO reductase YedYZ molybdopterin-dependent catalytic subunit
MQPRELERRTILKSSLVLGGALLTGNCRSASERGLRPGVGGCGDPFAGGRLLGVVPFVNEGDPSFGPKSRQGWDGRRFTDLSKVAADRLLTPTEEFYLRTFYPDGIDAAGPWNVQVGGLVSRPTVLSLEAIRDQARPRGAIVLECSGNFKNGGGFGMLSSAEWSGTLVSDLLSTVAMDPRATQVLSSGYDRHDVPSQASTPGASWIFPLADLAATGAFFATRMNGADLPPDHGFPVRLLVPGWYGCTCIKWVDEVRLVGDDEPATAQMREFASRTHQTGVPDLARDFRPASMDQAAMPTRIERWMVAGIITYRVVGILWGGNRPTQALAVRFGNGPYERVDVCPPQAMNRSWTLWSHRWTPTMPGTYAITLKVDDPTVPQKRLDAGFYRRETTITEV